MDRFIHQIDAMRLKEKVIRNIFWVGSAKGFGQITSWLLTVILARLLNPSDFGLMAMALVVISIMESFHEMGIGVVIIQKENIDDVDLQTCFWFSLFTGVVFSITLLLVAPIVAWFFKTKQLIEILQILSVNFVVIALATVPLNLLSRELEFKKRSALEFMSDLGSGIIAIGCALNGFGFWSLVIRSISRGVVFTGLIYGFFHWRPRFMFSYERLRCAMRFGLPVMGSKLLWYTYANSDYIIVGRYLGEHLLGLYRVAYLLSRKPLDKIWMIIGDLLLPVFSKLRSEGKDLQRVFLKFSKYMSFAIFPMNVGLILVAGDAIIVILGQKWYGILIPLQLLCVLGVLKTFDIGVAPLLNALGKPGLNLRLDLLACVAFPISFLVGVRFGLEGICISWLVIYPLMSIIRLNIALKEINLSYWDYLRTFSEPMFVTVFMIAMVLLCRFIFLGSAPHVIRLVVSCLVGALSYFICLMTLSSDARSNLKEMRSLLGKVKEKYAVG